MSHILIVGGGFAGLSAAVVAADEIHAAGRDDTVTLISDSDQITIRPRLYEKDPETLRAPLRPTLDAAGVPLVLGRVTGIDTGVRTVSMEGGDSLSYDRLILATGSELPPLPVPGVDDHTYNIDTYEAAVALDRRLQAIARDPDTPGNDTVVIIGGGMTGIELAAEMRGRLAEHAGETAAAANIVLIERADAIGPEFGENPRPVIEAALGDARVDVRLGTSVTSIDENGVDLSDGGRIDAATVVVTVGLRANGLTAQIPGDRDDLGRLVVGDDLKVAGLDDVYATGDVARAKVDENGNVALMSCQHARTMGKYAGLNVIRDLTGEAPRPYRQPNYTTCLDLGASGAVFTMGWDREVQTSGAEAKERKVMINTQWIYPPTGTTDEVFAALRIDENGR